jgi:hypothetical protein
MKDIDAEYGLLFGYDKKTMPPIPKLRLRELCAYAREQEALGRKTEDLTKEELEQFIVK